LRHALTVDRVESGMITLTPPGVEFTEPIDAQSYAAGTEVSLEASPSSLFLRWEWKDSQGNVISTETVNPTTTVMDGNKWITAVFSHSSQPFVNHVNRAAYIPGQPTCDSTCAFGVIFSEDVVNVTVDDFELSYTGTLSGASVAEVIPWTADYYIINAATGQGCGLLGLDVKAGTDIKDLEENSLTLVPYTSGERFDVLRPRLTLAATGSGTLDPSVGVHLIECIDEVSVTATPAEGWVFSHWDGDASGSDNPLTVAMDQDKSVTAVFTISDPVYLTTAVVGQGVVTPPPGGGPYEYPRGQTVWVHAIESYDSWHFDHWLETGSAENPTNVSMTTDMTMTAVFVQIPCNLTVETSGLGSVTPSTGTFNAGTPVTITAYPEVDWVFDHWDGDAAGTSNPLTFQITNPDTQITAVFRLTVFTLSATALAGGQITVDPLQEEYAEGTPVTVTASVPYGFVFDAWQGSVTSSDNPLNLIMDAPHSLVACYERASFPLSVSVEGNGSVVKTPDASTYLYGDRVTCEAVPGSQSCFDHWEGDLGTIPPSDNPIRLSMDSAKTLTAHFVDKVPLTVTAQGNGGVTVTPSSPDGLYAPGTPVTITAQPASSMVVSWSGDVVPERSDPWKAIVIMSEPKAITLSFLPAKQLSVSVELRNPLSQNTVEGLVAVQPLLQDWASTATTCSGYAPEGAAVSLNAKKECQTYRFQCWERADTGVRLGTDPVLNVKLDNDLAVRAVYIVPEISTHLRVLGEGMVTCSDFPSTAYGPKDEPVKHYESAGNAIVLTAVPAPGWQFDHWALPESWTLGDGNSQKIGANQITINNLETATVGIVFVPTPDYVSPEGDLNQDGQIDQSDVSIVAQKANTWDYLTKADVTYDGALDELDTEAITKTALCRNTEAQPLRTFIHGLGGVTYQADVEPDLRYTLDSELHYYGSNARVELAAYAAEEWRFRGWWNSIEVSYSYPVDAQLMPAARHLVRMDRARVIHVIFEYVGPDGPSAVDSDQDGLTDLWETANGTDPSTDDTDGDGLPDWWEVNYGLDPDSYCGDEPVFQPKATNTGTMADFPVVSVTWFGAIALCNWLSEMRGLSPCYTFDAYFVRLIQPVPNGYRLPTEHEWEYVAAFHESTDKYYVYGYSSDALEPSMANFNSNYENLPCHLT